MYMLTPTAELPWNAGGPDPDLVDLVESGTISSQPRVGHSLAHRQALDIGSGPGHDSVYLIQHGFDVIGIDISPSAITLTRENVSNHGLFGFFQVGDIRHIPVEDKWVDFANDRGCFHMVDAADQPAAAAEIARVMKPRGLFLLKMFAESQNLEALFHSAFHTLRSWPGEFAGPAKRKSHTFLLERK